MTMNRPSTLTRIGSTFVCVLIFLGSVTAVTAIRRSLRTNAQVATVARAVSAETIRFTTLTRSLLNP